MPIDVSSLSPALRQIVVKNGQVDMQKLNEVASSCVYSIALIDEATALLNGNKNWGRFDQFVYVQNNKDIALTPQQQDELDEMGKYTVSYEKFKNPLTALRTYNDGSYEIVRTLTFGGDCTGYDSEGTLRYYDISYNGGHRNVHYDEKGNVLSDEISKKVLLPLDMQKPADELKSVVPNKDM